MFSAIFSVTFEFDPQPSINDEINFVNFFGTVFSAQNVWLRDPLKLTVSSVRYVLLSKSPVICPHHQHRYLLHLRRDASHYRRKIEIFLCQPYLLLSQRNLRQKLIFQPARMHSRVFEPLL